MDETKPLSTGDQLAIVLFCVGAALALILFLVEKTPTSVTVILIGIAGFMVYPIFHFFRGPLARTFGVLVLLLSIGGFGKSVWPRETTSASTGQLVPNTPLKIPEKPAAAPAAPPREAITPKTRKWTLGDGPRKGRPADTPEQPASGSKVFKLGPGATATAEDCSAVGIDNTVNCEKPDPYASALRYVCNGWSLTTGGGGSAGVSVRSDPALSPQFKTMMELGQAQDWQGLLTASKNQIHTNPNWLTPYLLGADASFRTGNTAEAEKLLKQFDSEKKDSYTDAPCPEMEADLRSRMAKLP